MVIANLFIKYIYAYVNGGRGWQQWSLAWQHRELLFYLLFLLLYESAEQKAEKPKTYEGLWLSLLLLRS